MKVKHNIINIWLASIVIIVIVSALLYAIFFYAEDYSNGELELSISLDQTTPSLNDTINITFTLTNIGNETVRVIDLS